MQTLSLRIDGSEVMEVIDGFQAADEKAGIEAGRRAKPKPEAVSMLANLMRGISG